MYLIRIIIIIIAFYSPYSFLRIFFLFITNILRTIVLLRDVFRRDYYIYLYNFKYAIIYGRIRRRRVT